MLKLNINQAYNRLLCGVGDYITFYKQSGWEYSLSGDPKRPLMGLLSQDGSSATQTYRLKDFGDNRCWITCRRVDAG